MERFELPDGWEWRTLGNVANISAGTTAPQEEKYFTEGKYLFVRAQDLGRCGRTDNLVATTDCVNELAVNEKRLKRARKGAILFPKSGASILTGSRAKLGMDAYVVSHLAIAEGDPSIVDDSWLFHWLCTTDMIALAQSESGYPSLRLSDVKTIEIPVPSISEQKRLVARIETFGRRIKAGRAVQREASVGVVSTFGSIIAATFNSLSDVPIRKVGELTGIIGGASVPEDGPRPQSPRWPPKLPHLWPLQNPPP
ncbi:MAG: restriction endonuclease subunit S [Sulfuricellaceae bacterium]|nr:restriction endonuclease subunit S [Sulfuricellaceae bacterium]